MDQNQQMATLLGGQTDPLGYPVPTPEQQAAFNQRAKEFFAVQLPRDWNAPAPDWRSGGEPLVPDQPIKLPTSVTDPRARGLPQETPDPFYSSQAAALQWAMALAGGPRALRLIRDTEVGLRSPSQVFHIFDPKTEKHIGYVNTTYSPRNNNLHVDMIGGYPPSRGIPTDLDVWTHGPNSIGPGSMRSIIPEFQKLYPEIKSISGERVSGARGNSNLNVPSYVKFHIPQGGPPSLTSGIDNVSQTALARWQNKANTTKLNWDDQNYWINNDLLRSGEALSAQPNIVSRWLTGMAPTQ